MSDKPKNSNFCTVSFINRKNMRKFAVANNIVVYEREFE